MNGDGMHTSTTTHSAGSASKPLLVTVPHALQIVQVGRTKLYEMIGDGRVKAVKLDGRTLISYASLEQLASGQAA